MDGRQVVDGSGATRRRFGDNTALHRLAVLASGDPTVVRRVAAGRDAARSGLSCRKRQTTEPRVAVLGIGCAHALSEMASTLACIVVFDIVGIICCQL